MKEEEPPPPTPLPPRGAWRADERPSLYPPQPEPEPVPLRCSVSFGEATGIEGHLAQIATALTDIAEILDEFPRWR